MLIFKKYNIKKKNLNKKIKKMPLNDFIIGELIGKGTFSSVCLVKRKIDNQNYEMKRVKIVQ